MNVWLISDTHFGHENLYSFTTTLGGPRIRAPFANAAEGDEFMVDAWNARVRPEDHVWHLGDVTMDRSGAQKIAFVQLIRRLNGHKRLVLGNHDHFPVDVYRAAGFQRVKGSHKLGELLLTHYPVHPESIGGWALANVHGHIHEKPSPPGAYVNVSVERIQYQPAAFEDVLMWARAAREAAAA